jgi:uncharacterized membrane protein YedE/YeeE
MRQALAALAAGLLFGLGLTVSQMANPAKVLGFLDLAGDWDPSLAFVLAGAVATATIGFRLVQRAAGPLLAPTFRLPSATRIDRPLLLGAAIFGLGWGLIGFCPGPALAALGLDGLPVPIFILAMLAGMLLHRLRPSGRTPDQMATPAHSG